MKTASIDCSHAFGTKSTTNITATYRGKVVVGVTCHDSEENDKLAGVKKRLKLLDFTHYRDFGVGPLKLL